MNILYFIKENFLPPLELLLLFYVLLRNFPTRFPSSSIFSKICTLFGISLFYDIYIYIFPLLFSLPQASETEKSSDILNTDYLLQLPLLLALYCIICSFILFKKRNWLERTLIILIFIPLCNMFRVISYFTSKQWDGLISTTGVYLIRTFLTTLCLLAAALIMDKFFSQLFLNLKKTYIFFTCIAAVLFNIFSVIISQKISELSQITVLFCILIIFIIIFLFIAGRMISDYNMKITRQYQMQREMNARQHITEMEQATRELRKWKHEYQNQLLLLKSYGEEKRYDELQNTLEHLLTNMPQMEKQICTGNADLDMLLNHKLTEAKQAGIDTQVQISMADRLPFSREDLFSLINNLFNNAIEAASLADKPYLHFIIRPQKAYLLIQLRNTCCDNVLKNNPALKTTKQQKMFHGLGIPIIRSIVEKYNGTIEFTQEEQIFQCKILISGLFEETKK